VTRVRFPGGAYNFSLGRSVLFLDHLEIVYHLSNVVKAKALKQQLLNYNKKHLRNVGPIRHCEPPHADVHNSNNDNDDDNDNDNA